MPVFFLLLASITVPSISAPRSQRFPVMKTRFSLPVLNVLIVRRQLFWHFPQRRDSSSTWKFSRSLSVAIPERTVAGSTGGCPGLGAVKSTHWSYAIRAEPYAPIRPATSGRNTFTPAIFSKARSTASLKNVPP